MQSQNLNAGGMTAIMGGVGDVFNLVGAVNEYKTSQEQGDNAAISLAKGAGNFAWGEFYYGGVARLVNERGIHVGSHLISLGSTSSMIGKATGTVAGGIAGGIGGVAASPFVGAYNLLTKKGAAKAGSAMWGTITGGIAGGAKGIGTVGALAGQMGVTMALSMAPQLLAQMPKKWEHNAQVMTQAYRQRGKLGSGYFEMSQAGYTMRQRSLNAIRQNGLNTQTALGNEARMYYRGVGLDD